MQKLFQTTILEKASAHTFDRCFNGRLMFRQLTDLNFKWIEMIRVMPSLLAVNETSPFEF